MYLELNCVIALRTLIHFLLDTDIVSHALEPSCRSVQALQILEMRNWAAAHAASLRECIDSGFAGTTLNVCYSASFDIMAILNVGCHRRYIKVERTVGLANFICEKLSAMSWGLAHRGTASFTLTPSQ